MPNWCCNRLPAAAEGIEDQRDAKIRAEWRAKWDKYEAEAERIEGTGRHRRRSLTDVEETYLQRLADEAQLVLLRTARLRGTLHLAARGLGLSVVALRKWEQDLLLRVNATADISPPPTPRRRPRRPSSAERMDQEAMTNMTSVKEEATRPVDLTGRRTQESPTTQVAPSGLSEASRGPTASASPTTIVKPAIPRR